MKRETPFEIFDILNADDFFDPFNRQAFRSIKLLFDAGQSVGIDTLSVEMKKAGFAMDVNQYANLSGHYVSDPLYHAKVVKNFSLCRSLSKIAEDAKTDLLAEFPDGLQVADDIQEAIMQKTGEILPAPKTLSEAFFSVMDKSERIARGELVYPKSGIHLLDECLTGFMPGQLIVIAARPSVGKTSLMLSFLRNINTAGMGCTLFSLEMGIEELSCRIVCMDSGVPFTSIIAGKLTKHEKDAVARAMAAYNKKYPDFICEDSGIHSMSAVRAKILRNIQRHNTKIVAIDYLQLMTIGEGDTRDLQIGYITRNLKQMSRDCGVPILLLSQLNRSIEARDNKKPRLADLRDSGNIEQDADVVIFISRELDEKAVGASLSVAKNRNGGLKDVDISFLKEIMLFAGVETARTEEPERPSYTDI